jgi:hypothetical protein
MPCSTCEFYTLPRAPPVRLVKMNLNLSHSPDKIEVITRVHLYILFNGLAYHIKKETVNQNVMAAPGLFFTSALPLSSLFIYKTRAFSGWRGEVKGEGAASPLVASPA